MPGRSQRIKMTGDRLRVGIGYDIHPLVPGRALILGGVPIESDRGLDGHSDADALTHALCDALMGAANIGDLGRHFPETDQFRGVSSLVLLKKTAEMIAAKGYHFVNADCVVNAEAPRLSPYAAKMAENIGSALGAGKDRISIKFTRGEGMGPVGERKAIEARAVVLISKQLDKGSTAPRGDDKDE